LAAIEKTNSDHDKAFAFDQPSTCSEYKDFGGAEK
jgi:hypothetical protein